MNNIEFIFFDNKDSEVVIRQLMGIHETPLATRPAVYVILNEATGKFYVGQTHNLRTRVTQHRGELKRNTHKNIYLQKEYTECKTADQSFVLHAKYTATPEHALACEEEMLLALHGRLYCLNRASAKSAIGCGYDNTEGIRKITEWSRSPENRRWKSELSKEFSKTEVGKEQFRQVHLAISKPVTINGIFYNRISEAMKEIGVSHARIRFEMNRQKSNEITMEFTSSLIKSVVIFGTVFPTFTAAFKKLKISGLSLRHRLNSNLPEWKDYQWV
jgi:predicted GIY-YIG superfamily endonuclease